VAILYSNHSVTRLGPRGATQREVEEVLAKGLPEPARTGRHAKALVYPFGRHFGRRTHEQRKVKVIYAEEGADMRVITVYVYYGSWQ